MRDQADNLHLLDLILLWRFAFETVIKGIMKHRSQQVLVAFVRRLDFHL